MIVLSSLLLTNINYPPILVTAVTKRSIYISEVSFFSFLLAVISDVLAHCDFSALEPKRNVFGTIVFYVFV